MYKSDEGELLELTDCGQMNADTSTHGITTIGQRIPRLPRARFRIFHFHDLRHTCASRHATRLHTTVDPHAARGSGADMLALDLPIVG